MLISNKYYTLNKKKFLTDGKFIPEHKNILYICTQGDNMQFKFIENNGDVIVFWEKKDNVTFAEEKQEECDAKKHECHSKVINKSI